MRFTNIEAEGHYNCLLSVADKVTGKLGYTISRNLRKLNVELKEYLDVKNRCIEKYGELGDDGVFTLKLDSPKFLDYQEEMKQYEDIEIDVDIMKIQPDDIFDSPLTASEMLGIDFMLEE